LVTADALRKSSTSLVHAAHGRIAAFILSKDLPSLFLNPSAASASSAAVTAGRAAAVNHCYTSETSSLVSFVHRVASSSKARRAKDSVIFSLTLEDTGSSGGDDIASGKSSPDDGNIQEQEHVEKIADSSPSPPLVPPSTIVFSSLGTTKEIDAAPQAYMAALNKMRRPAGRPPPMPCASISGSITLEPRLHGTTQVTLSAVIAIKRRGVATEVTPDAENPPGLPSASRTKTMFGSTVVPAKKEGEDAAAALLDHLLAAVPALHNRFARHDEVDEATLKHFENVTVPTSPPLRVGEMALFDKIKLYDDQGAASSSWSRIPGTVNDSVNCYQKKASGQSSWVKAVADVDVSALRTVSDLWNFMSYERIREHASKNGNLLRKEIVVPDSHSKIMMAMQKFPGTLDNRVFSALWCWRKEADESFTLAFIDSSEADQFGCGAAKRKADDIIGTDATKAVRGSTMGFYRVEPLAPSVCKVTFVMQGIIGGSIPLMVINKVAKKSLASVKLLKGKYERSGKVVDAELRTEFPQPPPLGQLNADKASVVNRCLALETDEGLTALHSPSALVDMYIKYTPPAKGQRSVALGKAETIVDCSAKFTIAWMFSACSRERMMINAEERNPARLVANKNSPHDIIAASIKRMPFPLRDREFVVRQICATDEKNAGVLLLAVESVVDEIDYGMSTKVARGSVRAIFRFSPVGEFNAR
jgi:hypothetical protein